MEEGNGEFKGYAKAMIETIEKRFDDFQKQIDRRFTTIDVELVEIKSNHIAHLQSRLEDIESSLSLNRWWLIGLLGSVIATLVIEIIRRT